MKSTLGRRESLALLGFVGLAAFTLSHHEPWRDEAQAWLIARDLSFAGVLRQANYEGSPALWPLLLWPLAQAGAPYASMHVLHLAIACAFIYLVLFRSPFGFVTRIAFTFSYFACWEYAIVARNYAIGVLLLFSLASLHTQRHDRPLVYGVLIALLFQASVHAAAIAGALGVVFAFERSAPHRRDRNTGWALGLIVAGASLAVLQLLPAGDNRNAELFSLFSYRTPFIALANAFFPHVPRDAHLTVLGGLLVLAGCAASLRWASKHAFYILVLALGGLFYIFVFKHTGTLRHHGYISVLVLFLCWISYPTLFVPTQESGNRGRTWIATGSMASLTFCLILSGIASIRHHVLDYRYTFSDARHAADYVNAHLPEAAVVAAHPSIKASALAPFLASATLWYLDVDRRGTFVTWDTTYEAGQDLPLSAVLARFDQRAARGSGVFLMLDAPLPDDERTDLTLIYRTEEPVFGYGEERYFLYRRSAVP